MREITPDPFKVYRFEELDERAQADALENVADMLRSTWGDSFDIDSITETITYILAQELGTPGWDEFGEGDFPGIPYVKVTGWDLDRGQYVSIDGELDRDNAPALPWIDGLSCVYLSAQRDHTHVGVAGDGDKYGEREQAMHEAVSAAMNKAWQAGRDAMEYVGSEENAREWIEGNDPEFFLADGSIYS